MNPPISQRKGFKIGFIYMKYFPGIILIIFLISSFTGCNRSEVSDRENAEQKALIEEKRDMAAGLAAAIARIDEIIAFGDLALALKLTDAAEEIFGDNAQLQKQRQTIANTPTTTDMPKEIPLLPPLYKNTEELDQFMFMEDLPGRFAGMYFAQEKIAQEKDLEHALELSFCAEQLFGQDLMLWVQRSGIYDQAGKRTEAIAEIKKVLSTEPGAYNRIVKLYLKWDDKLMAIQTLEEALNDPRVKDDISLVSRWGLEQARLYREIGELKKAQSRVEETLRVLSAVDHKTNSYSTSEILKERAAELEKLMDDIREKSQGMTNFQE